MPTRYNVYSGYIHGGRKNNLIHALRGNLRVTDEFLKQFKNALNHGHRYHRVTQSPQIKQVLNNYARTLHRYNIYHQTKKNILNNISRANINTNSILNQLRHYHSRNEMSKYLFKRLVDYRRHFEQLQIPYIVYHTNIKPNNRPTSIVFKKGSPIVVLGP